MTAYQARIIERALASGVVRAPFSSFRALVRAGLVTWRGKKAVVTDEGRRLWLVFVRQSVARRDDEKTRPSLEIDGERVDLRTRCATCGRQLGSHLQRSGHPLPKAGCARFARLKSSIVAS